MFRFLALVVVMLFGWIAAGAAAPEASPQDVALPASSNGGSVVARFDSGAGEFPEAVAVAPGGSVYASLSPLGQVVRIVLGGAAHEVVGTVEGLQEGDPGLLGLASDADGRVYGAVVSANPDAHGVWRFDVEAGTAERVPGTDGLAWPNAIAINSQGALYVTDSLGGSVWRVPPGGTAELWVEHELLTGSEVPIGANGIALDEGSGTLYVGVSAQGTVVVIPLLADGSAGEPAIHAAFTNDQGVVGVDGVALDGAGNLYVAQPVANTVVQVTTDGAIEAVVTGEDGLDGPTSVAVGSGSDGGESLFVASWSDALGDFAPPSDAGPSVVAAPLG